MKERLSVDIPEGWKLVPIEPTREMIEAGLHLHYGEITQDFRAVWTGPYRARWKAMIEAAPSPPVT